MRVAGPSFAKLLDPTGDGDLTGGEVLRVGVVDEDGGPALRLRYRTEVLDAAAAARIAGYHHAALALIAADPEADHPGQTLLSDEELRSSWTGWQGRGGSCRIAASTSCSRSGCGAPDASRPRCTGAGSGPTGS